MEAVQLDWAGAGDRGEELSASDVPEDCDIQVDFSLEDDRSKNNLYLDKNENICKDHCREKCSHNSVSELVEHFESLSSSKKSSLDSSSTSTTTTSSSSTSSS